MAQSIGKIALEHLNSMKKRIEFLIGARVYNRKKIIEASEDIDRMRRKVKGKSGVEMIRQYRGAI